MEDKIEAERMGRDIGMITELNLDNCKSSTVTGLSENWSSLEKLSLINVGLTTLKDFPKLPKLNKLKLCDNKLSDEFEELTNLPNLSHLNLSGNKIKDFKNLTPLSKIKTLRSLNLISCDISSQDGYKEKIFEMFPHLIYLDGFDKDENPEVEVCADSDLANDMDEEEELEEEEEEEDDDDEDEEEDSCEEEEDIPLEALYNKSYTNDTADDDDFEIIDDEDEGDEDIEEEDVDDDDVVEVEDDHVSSPPTDAEGKSRGVKRKHESEEVQQNGKTA